MKGCTIDEYGSSLLMKYLDYANPIDFYVVNHLLKLGNSVNQIDINGDTPLLSAAENPTCSLNVFRILIETGANPNWKNKEHEGVITKYLDAVQNIDQRVIKFLMESGLILNNLAIYDYKAIKKEIIGIDAETKILLSMLMKKRSIIK